MKHYNIPIFIAHFGCPNKCVFCNQNKITGIETNIQPEEVKGIIDEYLCTLPSYGEKELAFFGGTFTAISIPLQKEFLSVAKEFIDKGLIKGIRLSTRPDNIDLNIVKMLKEYGVTTVELGVQSLDNKVLSLSERGYRKEEVERAVKLLKDFQIEVGIQIMPGLPGSSFKSDLQTVKEVIEMKPNFTRVYPTLVISDTKLEKMFKNNEFVSLSLDEAVDLTSVIIAVLENCKIPIIRVGLQPSEDIREEGVIVAGPFHPAFRELCESNIYRLFFEEKLITCEKIIVKVSHRDVSRVSGIRGSNKKYFGKRLEIIVDETIEKGSFYLNNQKYCRENLLKNVLRVVLNEADNN